MFLIRNSLGSGPLRHDRLTAGDPEAGCAYHAPSRPPIDSKRHIATLNFHPVTDMRAAAKAKAAATITDPPQI